MKRTILCLATLVAALFAAPPDGKPDFSGYWELNLAKSKFGKMVKPTRMTLTVQREGDRSKAEQTTWNEQGESSSSGIWYLDGKDRPAEEAGRTMEKTHWDGNVLVNEKQSLDRTFVETVRMSLSPDGKTATEEVRVKSPNGDTREILVFDKKEKPAS